MRRSWLVDTAAIFLLTVALLGPLFRVEYMDRWASIESTFISDARLLRESFPHNNWQPNWYTGTRFDYIYPPALRYGTASLAALLNVSEARGYHIYIGLVYALGIAAVYLMIRLGTESRGAAWLGAAATALLSPALWLVKEMRGDAWLEGSPPQRLNVLIRWGEGPHISSLAFIPLALGCAFVALRGRSWRWTAAAGIFSALVVSNNFYGATALAIFFPILVWSVWITQPNWRIFAHAAAIPAIAYGLCAFWLTPSYLDITLANMRWVSHPGNRWSVVVAVSIAIAYMSVTWSLTWWKPRHAWRVFVAGSAIFFALNVLGHYYFEFRVMGEPLRLVPELDFVLLLGIIELARAAWNATTRAPVRVAVALAIVILFIPSRRYLRRAWLPFAPSPTPYKQRVEYRVTEWMARNQPHTRSLAAGSIRFWYNAWFTLPQVGGGSEQGMLNQVLPWPQWEATAGSDPDHTKWWMQAMGAGAIIVMSPESSEIYHDYAHPNKFEGWLPVLYRDPDHVTIYKIPRRYESLARTIETARLIDLQPLGGDNGLPKLEKYVQAIESEAIGPADVTRVNNELMRIRARVPEGYSLLVQESYDPSWRAVANGRALAIRRDPAGFMLIATPPGDQLIELRFALPLENTAGRIATLSTIALAVWLLFRKEATK